MTKTEIKESTTEARRDLLVMRNYILADKKKYALMRYETLERELFLLKMHIDKMDD